MTESDIYQRLAKQARNGYRVNELIRFTYPARHVKLEVTVAKRLDRTLEGIYRVLLKAIGMGFDTRQALYEVLGIEPLDGFIQRELFGLRERGFINSVDDKWVVNPAGHDFLKDPSLIMTEEQEEFECFIDSITGKPFTMAGEPLLKVAGDKTLFLEIKLPQRLSGAHIESISDDLRRIYDRRPDGSVLLGYAPDPIKYERSVWLDRWVVEYVPEPGESGPPRIDVFKAESLDRDKRLTERFNEDYDLLIALSDSDRVEAGTGHVLQCDPEVVPTRTITQRKESVEPLAGTVSDQPQVLGIWETKQKFKESLLNVRGRVLIESPWIKRATQECIPLFQKLLEARKELVVLYGIESKDEHDVETLDKLKALANKFPDHFRLVHLPSHLRRIGHPMVGSHRKLLIKDSDYFILGSFNFLSMGQTEGQRVANEQSILVGSGVEEMWFRVINEYGLPSH